VNLNNKINNPLAHSKIESNTNEKFYKGAPINIKNLNINLNIISKNNEKSEIESDLKNEKKIENSKNEEKLKIDISLHKSVDNYVCSQIDSDFDSLEEACKNHF